MLTSLTLIAAITAREPQTPTVLTALAAPVSIGKIGESFEGQGRGSESRLPNLNGPPWSRIEVQRGDTFASILRSRVQDWAEVMRLVQRNPTAEDFYQLRPGDILNLRFDPAGRLNELFYEPTPSETLHLQRVGDELRLNRHSKKLENRLAYVAGTIGSSFFEDAIDAGLTESLVMNLVEIFGWDVDFAINVHRGDSFAVIYEERYWLGQKVSDGIILAAEFINRGNVYRAYAAREEHGFTRYYQEDGMSVRRAFLRTPVQLSRISSRYSSGRYHPILKTWRAHKGVDYAAPTGTPVRATAKGRVMELGTRGGYGKVVTIKHAGLYSTLYAHLSRFRPGLRAGSYVEQGQIIGYVGATGLATGPHLHYEFRVNDQHRDPLTFNFPGSSPIPAHYRNEFFHRMHSLSRDLDLIGQRSLVAKAKQ